MAWRLPTGSTEKKWRKYHTRLNLRLCVLAHAGRFLFVSYDAIGGAACGWLSLGSPALWGSRWLLVERCIGPVLEPRGPGAVG